MFATAYAPKESVELAGHCYDLDELIKVMDDEIYAEACDWAGCNATDQAILDVYVRLHEKRHGAPFAAPATLP